MRIIVIFMNYNSQKQKNATDKNPQRLTNAMKNRETSLC